MSILGLRFGKSQELPTEQESGMDYVCSSMRKAYVELEGLQTATSSSRVNAMEADHWFVQRMLITCVAVVIAKNLVFGICGMIVGIWGRQNKRRGFLYTILRILLLSLLEAWGVEMVVRGCWTMVMRGPTRGMRDMVVWLAGICAEAAGAVLGTVTVKGSGGVVGGVWDAIGGWNDVVGLTGFGVGVGVWLVGKAGMETALKVMCGPVGRVLAVVGIVVALPFGILLALGLLLVCALQLAGLSEAAHPLRHVLTALLCNGGFVIAALPFRIAWRRVVTGSRTKRIRDHIREPLQVTDREAAMRFAASHLDWILRSAPAAWHFWAYADAFFRRAESPETTLDLEDQQPA